ncbi:hypothetical protein [Comamonas sp.]|uniref:hypothetical protein n=1 Tax=Comamonas sp. TaxID=34028 RepID=UPI002FC61116
MDLKSVVQAHEKGFKGKKYLFIPREGCDRILILLSAHNQGDKYFLLRSFVEKSKYNLLFIADPGNSWYLNEDFGASYVELIRTVLLDFDAEKSYIFGSSMAGYAAINFAVQLGIHALICNPQVDLNLTLDYGWYELNKNIAKLTSKRLNADLGKLLNESRHDKVMCIVHGHAPIDVANVELILGSAAPIRKLLVYTLDTDDHSMPFGRDVDKVYKALDLIDHFHDFNVHVEDQNSQMAVLRENRKKSVAKNNIHHSRSLSGVHFEDISWVKRYAVNDPGVYFCNDVGFYNSKGILSGCLLSFDGDDFTCITNHADSMKKSASLGLSVIEALEVNNGDGIFQNAWARVPEGGSLTALNEGLFLAEFESSKNCYLNWELIKEFSADVKEGMYVSCLFDVELSGGKITLSLGGYGNAGYYQVNKVIDASGCYGLTFHISNILPQHRDALFARVYFYPDGVSKEVKLNRFSAILGYYPDVSFWSFRDA